MENLVKRIDRLSEKQKVADNILFSTATGNAYIYDSEEAANQAKSLLVGRNIFNELFGDLNNDRLVKKIKSK
ncbi:hypothetical protein [Vagococcus intermedius]|uniref:Uncharacterized protein n=1 Tax=Vagococcus intermedius TaxID=2991418 RepID=A0AAF0CWN2_9ENTE|nr:hypothetical protein [Vagococcus intermedius]WEG74379.1 hypothetical protein OL234_10765 [Vagococcus intermedius]WEG76501.1 hypothetical protein OL235_10930 [Vagococcus intermedius]